MHCELGGTASPSSRSGLLRALFLIALLFIEIFGLSLFFDTGKIPANNLWSALVGISPQLLQIAIAVAAAMLVFSGDGISEGFFRFMQLVSNSNPRCSLWTSLHLCAATLFIALSGALFASQTLVSLNTFAGYIWFVAGVSLVASWSLALLPLHVWRQILANNQQLIWIGLITGAVATAIALVTAQLWKPLGESTLYLVAQLLDVCYSDVICHHAKRVIGTQAFRVRIAPACSGYEGIGLIEVFLAVYLWVNRASFRFPHALLLLPLGAIIIWFINVLRIFCLIAIGTSLSADLAHNGFHSQAGWIGFNFVALSLVLISSRLPFVNLESRRAVEKSCVNPAAPYLMPLIAVLATTIVGAAFTKGFDTLYPLRVVAALTVLWIYRRAYGRLAWPGSIFSYGMGALTCVLWIMLIAPMHASGESPLAGWRELPEPWGWVWLAFRFMGYMVVIPIVEELAFRGYLLRRLIDFEFQQVPLRKFTLFSFVGSSLVFGILHGQHWLAGTLAGMLFAAAMHRRGRLSDAIIAHAVTNSLLAGYALYTGNWWLIS